VKNATVTLFRIYVSQRRCTPLGCGRRIQDTGYRIYRIAVNTLNQQSYSKRLGTTTLCILELTLRNIMRYCFLNYFNEASFCTCWTQLITSVQLLELIRVSMHLIVTLTHCICQHGMCVRLGLSHLSVSVNSLSDFDSI
jgi:hypothetical protein